MYVCMYVSGSLIRLDRNRQPRMKSPWHPLNLINDCHFLTAMMSPECRLKTAFGTRKQNEQIQRLYEHFSGTKFCFAEQRCPQNRGVPKEKLRYNRLNEHNLRSSLVMPCIYFSSSTIQNIASVMTHYRQFSPAVVPALEVLYLR